MLTEETIKKLLREFNVEAEKVISIMQSISQQCLIEQAAQGEVTADMLRAARAINRNDYGSELEYLKAVLSVKATPAQEPSGYFYEWDGIGIHRSFDDGYWNGAKPDRVIAYRTIAVTPDSPPAERSSIDQCGHAPHLQCVNPFSCATLGCIRKNDAARKGDSLWPTTEQSKYQNLTPASESDQAVYKAIADNYGATEQKRGETPRTDAHGAQPMPDELTQLPSPQAIALSALCKSWADHSETLERELARVREELKGLDFDRNKTATCIAGLLDKCAASQAREQKLLEALRYHQEQTRPIQRTIDILATPADSTALDQVVAEAYERCASQKGTRMTDEADKKKVSEL